MRILPARIVEHPVETFLAGALLLIVLLGTAENGRDAPGVPAAGPHAIQPQTM